MVAVLADGRYFLGPDNGLLSLSVGQAKSRSIVRLANRRYWLKEVSRTFHGRDILAPAAAYLACGGSLRQLGPPIQRIAAVPLPPLVRRGHRIEGRVIHLDVFGNLVTNLPGSLVTDDRHAARHRLRYQHRRVRVVSSYGEGRAAELIAVVGSRGFVELAIREDSAARRLGGSRGDPVELSLS